MMNKIHPLNYDIQGIIWDLDGTLYRFDAIFLEACNTAAAKAAIKLGVPLDLDAAINFAWKSHADTGQSILHFLSDYGVKPAAMHETYHHLIDEKLIEVTEQTSDYFQRLSDETNISHMILTHASKEWAIRTLSHLGLKSFFQDSHIVGREDYDFLSKCTDIEPFEMGRKILGTEAAKTLVIEDTLKNLKPAHEHGFKTVHFHHGRIPDPAPDFVHFSYPNMLEFFESYFS